MTVIIDLPSSYNIVNTAPSSLQQVYVASSVSLFFFCVSLTELRYIHDCIITIPLVEFVIKVCVCLCVRHVFCGFVDYRYFVFCTCTCFHRY